MKKQKPYKLYLTHVPNELWAKIEKEFRASPLLKDRRNSYNRIICKAIEEHFKSKSNE